MAIEISASDNMTQPLLYFPLMTVLRLNIAALKFYDKEFKFIPTKIPDKQFSKIFQLTSMFCAVI